MEAFDRRRFLTAAGCLAGEALAGTHLKAAVSGKPAASARVAISGHIWVYASKFPPDWDCTPVLEQAFSDFQYAGLEGMELMEINLRHTEAVTNLRTLTAQYGVPVTGASYGADMWDARKHAAIREDAELVLGRLQQLNGKTLGVSVGDAGRLKTEAELDAQADLLLQLLPLCSKYGVVLNLHNHTYEVRNGLHDLKGTLKRIPGIPLGPDLNWLVRAGVDPAWFIRTYGKQIVYMHLRDQRADGKWTETLGSGVTDFKAIAAALEQQRFKGRAAIELAFDEPPVHALREDWKNSLLFVKRNFRWT